MQLLARSLGTPNDYRRYDVLLQGPNFDDAWLAKQHDLRSLPIDQLLLSDTRLSRESVLRLFDRNRMISFNAAGVPLTDQDAQRIGEREELTHLNVMQTEITDEGLSALNVRRLIALDVSGTRITSAALQQELTGGRIQYLGVNGQQLTPELAAQLAGQSTLNMLRLAGPDVTDAHVKLLEGMPGLRFISIDQTTATPAAIDALRAANQQAQVDVFDVASAFFKWQAE